MGMAQGWSHRANRGKPCGLGKGDGVASVGIRGAGQAECVMLMG